jgi:hypothetical protein
MVPGDINIVGNGPDLGLSLSRNGDGLIKELRANFDGVSDAEGVLFAVLLDVEQVEGLAFLAHSWKEGFVS